MSPEELALLKEAATLLKDSGILEVSNEPGGQTMLIYSLIGLVFLFGFRTLVVDKISSNIAQFHRESLTWKQEMEKDFKEGLTIFGEVKGFLGEISKKLIAIQEGQSGLYTILKDKERKP